MPAFLFPDSVPQVLFPLESRQQISHRVGTCHRIASQASEYTRLIFSFECPVWMPVRMPTNRINASIQGFEPSTCRQCFKPLEAVVAQQKRERCAFATGDKYPARMNQR